jgi:hypothetical protein
MVQFEVGLRLYHTQLDLEGCAGNTGPKEVEDCGGP